MRILPLAQPVCRLLQKPCVKSEALAGWEPLRFSFADINSLIDQWHREINLIIGLPAKPYDPNWRKGSNAPIQLELPLT